MKQRTSIITAAVGVTGVLMGLGIYGLLLGPSAPVMATHPTAQSGSGTKYSVYRPQAPTLLEGVVVSLNSLRLMKRAIASSPDSQASDVPMLAILNEPIKTTGLGPIQIGMSLDEVESAGLTMVPVEGSDRGECQYYRIQGHSEPIGFMVIDRRILRIDVWPGSLTETLSGAKIGSSEADLVRYYGDQLEAVPNPITLGKTVVFKPKDPGEDLFRLVFETDDREQVVQYRVGQFPSVTWPEGCL
jgi:hypothetical protein